MDILTERTKFFCTAAPAVNFSITISGNVTHNSKKVLTTKTKLSGKGICPILTAAAQGTPQQCQFQQTPWINFSLTCKADSNPVLTENSFCACPVPVCAGSFIRVKTANAQGLTN